MRPYRELRTASNRREFAAALKKLRAMLKPTSTALTSETLLEALCEALKFIADIADDGYSNHWEQARVLLGWPTE